MRISLIVPTLNEERFLPRLLDSLSRQEYPIHEVIVADAHSRDRTRDVAQQRGCRVVLGGAPGPGGGRNAGAAVASGDTLLFVDADVSFPRGFLRRFVERFERKGVVVATPVYHPSPFSAFERAGYLFGNFVMFCLQGSRPLAAGYCIMIRRSVFEAIGGFDERLLLAEDHDMVRRATHHGRFRVLLLPIETSTRRYRKQGSIRLSLRYVMVTLGVIAGKRYERSRTNVRYEFGNWD